MSRRKITCLLIIAVSAFTSTMAAAKDEIPFAEKLAEKGYFDLAQSVCEELKNSASAKPEDKKAIVLVEAQINKSMADSERDPEKKKKFFEDAVKGYETFIKDNPTHPQLASAQFKIAELYQSKGQGMVDVLKAETDKAKRQAIVTEADQIFKSSTDYLEKLIQKFHGDSRWENELTQARYLLCVGYYLHASLFIDDASRQSALAKKAISLIEEMQWSYDEGLIFMFDLWVYRGLAHQCLKEYERALESFRTGGNLYDSVADTEHYNNSFVVSIISRAAYFGAQCAIEAKKFDDAIAFVDDFLKKYPGEKDVRFGLACRIEKGKALYLSNRTAEGSKELNLVVVKGGFWGNEAAQALNKLSGAGGSTLSPDVYLALADSKIGEDDYIGGIRAAQRVLGAAKTKEDQQKYIPQALHKIGICYSLLDRPWEAATAFGVLAKRYPKADMASRCAFEAARSYSTIAGASGNPGDDALYDEALKYLTATFPDSKEAKNVQFLVAKRLEDKAREDKKKLLEAAEQYAKVSTSAGPLYELALSRVGYCYYQYARAIHAEELKTAKDDAGREAAKKKALEYFDKGIKGFNVYMQFIEKEKVIDPKLLNERRELTYGCMDCLANMYMHAAVNTPDKVLDLFKNVHVDFADKPEKIAKAWTLMIQADLRRGKVVEAETRFRELMEKFAEDKRITLAAKEVGFAFEGVADDVKAKDAAKASEMRKKAAEYFYIWLTESKKRDVKVPLKEMNAAGDKLFSIALEEKAPEAFKQSIQIFQWIKERAGADEKLPVDEWKIDWKIGECHLSLKEYANALPIFEKLKIDKPEMGVIHQELAEIYVGMADQEGKLEYRDKALDIVANLVARIDKGSEPWWKSQGMLAKLLYDSGKYPDAALKIKGIEMAYPSFDNDTYGVKTQMLDLKKKLANKITPK